MAEGGELMFRFTHDLFHKRGVSSNAIIDVAPAWTRLFQDVRFR